VRSRWYSLELFTRHTEIDHTILTITDFAVLGILFELFTRRKAFALLLTATNGHGRVAMFIEGSKSEGVAFSLAGGTACSGGKLSSLVDE